MLHPNRCAAGPLRSKGTVPAAEEELGDVNVGGISLDSSPNSTPEKYGEIATFPPYARKPDIYSSVAHPIHYAVNMELSRRSYKMQKRSQISLLPVFAASYSGHGKRLFVFSFFFFFCLLSWKKSAGTSGGVCL